MQLDQAQKLRPSPPQLPPLFKGQEIRTVSIINCTNITIL